MSLLALNNISNFSGMEFSTFKLKHGISEDELFKAADDAVKGFMTKEDGFLGHAIGVCQGSCRVNRFHYAAFWHSITGRSGLSMTVLICDQFRVFPGHRSGRSALAA